jgi:hypothetical protein
MGRQDRGRKSLRLKSKRFLSGNNILVLDIDHMPSTVGNVLPKGCSLWPAFWTVGPAWPYNGEIDLIEYVNIDSSGTTALHTSESCSMSSVPIDSFSGEWRRSWDGNLEMNCDWKAPGQDVNSGCVIGGPANSVGAAFNSRRYGDIKERKRRGSLRVGGENERKRDEEKGDEERGGIYVMQWAADKEITTFFFPRDEIPLDLKEKNPKPETWGLPYSRFIISPHSDCSPDHFKDHQIMFDTTFCGDWAGMTDTLCHIQGYATLTEQ